MLVNSRKQVTSAISRVSAQDLILGDKLQLRNAGYLTDLPKRNKISWYNSNPYNQRWQYKWKHAYYTYPKDSQEHTYVHKPEDSKEGVPLFWNYVQDITQRWIPGVRCWWDRRHRMYDNFTLYFLPGTSVFLYQFGHLHWGFTVNTTAHTLNSQISFI